MWIYESDYKIVSKLNENESEVLTNICQQKDNYIVRYYAIQSICIFCKGSCAYSDLTPTVTPTLYKYLSQMKEYKCHYMKKQCENWLKYRNKELFLIKDSMKQDYSQTEKIIERIGLIC